MNLAYGDKTHWIEELCAAEEYVMMDLGLLPKFEKLSFRSDQEFIRPVDEKTRLKQDISRGLRSLASRIDAGLEMPIELTPGTYAFNIQIGAKAESPTQEKSPDVMSVTRSICK